MVEGSGGLAQPVAFSVDGSVLAADTTEMIGTGDNRILNHYIQLWNIKSGQSTFLRTEAPSMALVFSPDGSTLFSGLIGGGLLAWDTTTLEYRVFSKSASSIHSMVLSSDGSTLAVSHYNLSIIFWDTNTGERLQEIKTGSLTQSMAFRPNESVILM
jgi:WD40 repeat protein